MSKREWGENGGDRPPKRSNPGSSLKPHAFKVLAPDSLVADIMGSRGSTKDQIQRDSGTKMIFSNRDDYFPGTQFRTLVIYGDEPSNVLAALELIVPKLVETADVETDRAGANAKESELIGKEPGEYVFRCSISKRISGALIGRSGEVIKQLRSETSAKVFVENESIKDHKMVRIIGLPEAISTCLAKVNEIVQNEASNEGFSQWAAAINFEEMGAAEDSSGSGGRGGRRDESDRGWGRGNHEDRSWHDDHHSRRDRHHEDRHDYDDRQSGGRRHGGSEPGVEDEIGWFADICRQVPQPYFGFDYSITCSLPSDSCGAIIGRGGENITEVQRATGTKVTLSQRSGSGQAAEFRTLTIVGPLLNVYAAHMQLMKLYNEQQEEPNPDREVSSKIEDLQRQIAELQNPGKPGGKGGGGGGGGSRGRRY